jgi:hypothetical protein
VKMNPLNNKNKIANFKNECISLYLDTGVKTIKSFIKEVEALSLKYNILDIPSFKGDMLEILSEIFFGAFRNDTSIGIREYNPIPLDEDYGVDAIGINVNNDKCAIQVKYRANPLDLIEYTDMAKTYTSARIRNNIPLENDNTLYLFTTAYSITTACDTVFGKKLRVINRNIIAGKIDNNHSFWDEAQLRIMKTFEELSQL